MSGGVKPNASALTIHTQSEITRMDQNADGWSLHSVTQADGVTFDQLILAIPQPQARKLLSPWPRLQAQIDAAEMNPCWTVMVGFDAPLATDMTYANDVNGPISVIARETAKPGRDLPGDGWVIQANADWTCQHLEWDRAEVVPAILDAFFGALGCTLVAPAISMAHRWRYALASKPLGQPYLTDVALGLSVCGDRCLGPTAQDAFSSGRRLATALLSD